MQTSSTDSFPPLPLDILRLFTEFASCSSRSTALSFTLVSARTRIWALPHLYNTVLLRSTSSVKRFYHSLQSSSSPRSYDPPTPLSQRVKHLAIVALGPATLVQEIISKCTDLQSLACGHLGTVIHPELLQHQLLRERHLLGLSCRDGIPFPRLSPTTTHLHLQIVNWEALPTLLQLQTHLPELSHLALSLPSTILSGRPIHILLAEILERNGSIEVVLVQTTDLSEERFGAFSDSWRVSSLPPVDDRVLLKRISRSTVAQWEETSTSLDGLWGEAERELHLRKLIKS